MNKSTDLTNEIKMNNVCIRIAADSDIRGILEAFSIWHKTRKQFIDYLAKQDRNESKLIVVVTEANKIVGYANVFWQSRIDWHGLEGIPEIVDLNVISEYQRKGIATQMICYLEKLILEKGISAVGIAVESINDYLPANKLYLKLGYKKEKKNTIVDGEEVLVMRKSLSKNINLK